ncbi:MAG: 6-bladed beta-propeller [Prolixibacteraceae bacterium]
MNLEDRTAKILYSQIVDSVHLIQLETTKECLVGEIDQILKDDTLLFLLDKHQKTIFIFSESGRYIRKIDYIGKGEGEYISSSSFCVYPQLQRLYLFDQTQKKLLVYDYEGRYLYAAQSQNMDIVRNIGLSEDGNILCFTPDKCAPFCRDGLWEVDLNGTFIKEYRTVDPNHKFSWVGDHYSNCEGKISFYDCFTDGLFSFQNGELVREYQFDLKQRMPSKYLARKDGVKKEGTNNYYMNFHIAEVSNYYYLQYRSNKLGDVHVFFEKSTKNFLISDSLVNDFGIQSPINIFTYNKQALCALAWGDDPSINPELQLLYLKGNNK